MHLRKRTTADNIKILLAITQQYYRISGNIITYYWEYYWGLQSNVNVLFRITAAIILQIIV